MTELDQVAALAGAGRVAVTAEAVQRGEVASSQCASTGAWVAQHAPSLAGGGGAGQLAKCVEQLRRPILAPVRDAVLAGELSVPVALVVVSEFDKLRGRIIPEAEPLVLAGLVDIGVQDGAREVRQLRPRLLAEHGAPGELQDEQDRAAAQVTLSHPSCVDDGVWEYLLRVDAEAKAILEAAIGPLSAPWHPGGARDARSAAQRRGQALIEVCRRVTAAAKAAGPFGGHPTTAGTTPVHPEPVALLEPPRAEPTDTTTIDSEAIQEQPNDLEVRPVRNRSTTASIDAQGTDPEPLDAQTMQAVLAGLGAGGAKATLLLTMGLTDLTERVGAATTMGSLDAGALLAPETARRIACDAAIIPVLLGTHSEVLDLGRAERLFSPAQARSVLLRDRHCSFPSCDIPGFWTQLHHVWHWLDGGGTDLGNAALLCARHHTIVHRDRLTATVTPTGVHWDCTPGSYDRALARNRRRAA